VLLLLLRGSLPWAFWQHWQFLGCFFSTLYCTLQDRLPTTRPKTKAQPRLKKEQQACVIRPITARSYVYGLS
jgi:hypothetical protein